MGGFILARATAPGVGNLWPYGRFIRRAGRRRSQTMASTPGLLPGLLHWKARCRLLQSFPPIRSRCRRPGRCGGHPPPPPTHPPPTLPPRGPRWWQRLSALTRAQRMRLGAGVALLVLAAVAALVLGHQPDYRVLFGNLSDKDCGTIIAPLSQMNVPSRRAEGGGAILVPADRVHEVRLRLASQGLPKGSVLGFELMESSKFGVTQFQER